MKNKKYFQLTQRENEADLYIFGDIVEELWFENEVSPNSLMAQLEKIECENLNVYINSYGGSVSAGLTIYNQLKRHKAKVTTYCEGFACSIASIIFMAGDNRVMSNGSLLMIHNPWTVVSGNAKDLRKEAEALDKIAQASINIYMENININEEELINLLDNETWLTPQEAIEFGFATSLIEDNAEAVCQSVKQSLIEMIIKMKEDAAEEEEEDVEDVEEDTPEEETEEEEEEEKTVVKEQLKNKPKNIYFKKER